MLAETFGSLLTSAADIFRAVVVRANDDGTVLVAGDSTGHRSCLCDRLVTGAEPLALGPGDTVLCHAASTAERGVILGRIGPSRTPAPAPADDAHAAPDDAGTPDTLLIQAKEQITLRVGEGSITIRADGKVLIKGKDLVSHATRVNRIKGGSVAIN